MGWCNRLRRITTCHCMQCHECKLVFWDMGPLRAGPRACENKAGGNPIVKNMSTWSSKQLAGIAAGTLHHPLPLSSSSAGRKWLPATLCIPTHHRPPPLHMLYPPPSLKTLPTSKSGTRAAGWAPSTAALLPTLTPSDCARSSDGLACRSVRG